MRFNVSCYMSEIVEIVEEVMGGISGFFYSIFFVGLVSVFGFLDFMILMLEIWGICF